MKLRQKTRKALILISFILFPITMFYLSPALIIEAASKGIINGSFISFSIMFIFSLLLGRLYCGWICPGADIQEICFELNDKPVKKGNWIKFFIWVPWLSIIIALYIKSGGFSSVQPFFYIKYGISMSEPQNFIIYYFFLVLFVILSLAAEKRPFCHHACWMAPLMIIGRKIRNIFKWPSLKLDSKPEKCTKRHTCSQNCPMSLEAEKMVSENKMETAECILCGSCIDGCKNSTIHFAFKRYKPK